MRVRARLALAACLIVASSALPWRAEARSAVPSEPSDAQIERRLAFIENSLDARQRYAQIWFWSWMTVHTASTVGLSVEAALADNAADRVNSIGNATLSALGIGDMLLFRPVDARFGSGPIRALPDATREQRLRKLEAAEALLRRNAERSDDRYDWRVHAGNIGSNALVGGLTWAAGDARSGLITVVAQSLIGELYLWSAPSGPAKDWEAYQRLKAGEPPVASTGWSLAALPGGVALTYRF